jgi:hypothetical protein
VRTINASVGQSYENCGSIVQQLVDADYACRHVITDTVPFVHLDQTLSLELTQQPGAGYLEYPGNPVRWRSETAPAMLSPQQVVQFGGASCTGKSHPITSPDAMTLHPITSPDAMTSHHIISPDATTSHHLTSPDAMPSHHRITCYDVPFWRMSH